MEMSDHNNNRVLRVTAFRTLAACLILYGSLAVAALGPLARERWTVVGIVLPGVLSGGLAWYLIRKTKPLEYQLLQVAGFYTLAILVVAFAPQIPRRNGPPPTPAPTLAPTPTLTPTPPPIPTSTPEPEEEIEPEERKLTAPDCLYLVKEGETLFDIAPRFGTSPAQLQIRNGIQDPRALRAQEYIIADFSTAIPLEFAESDSSQLAVELRRMIDRSIELEWWALQTGELDQLAEVYVDPVLRQRRGRIREIRKRFQVDPERKPAIEHFHGWAVGECAVVMDIETWGWYETKRGYPPYQFFESYCERYYFGRVADRWYIFTLGIEKYTVESE